MKIIFPCKNPVFISWNKLKFSPCKNSVLDLWSNRRQSPWQHVNYHGIMRGHSCEINQIILCSSRVFVCWVGMLDISSNFRLRTSNLLLGCSWSIYTVGWAKVSWSSTLSNILVGLVTAILFGWMSNILVLGHFPSTTSTAQFPQSQISQQQFPQPLISPTINFPVTIISPTATSPTAHFPNTNFPSH